MSRKFKDSSILNRTDKESINNNERSYQENVRSSTSKYLPKTTSRIDSQETQGGSDLRSRSALLDWKSEPPRIAKQTGNLVIPRNGNHSDSRSSHKTPGVFGSSHEMKDISESRERGTSRISEMPSMEENYLPDYYTNTQIEAVTKNRRRIWSTLYPQTQLFLIAIYGSFDNYMAALDPTKDRYSMLDEVCILYDRALEQPFLAVKALEKLGYPTKEFEWGTEEYLSIIEPQIVLYYVLVEITSDREKLEKYAK